MEGDKYKNPELELPEGFRLLPGEELLEVNFRGYDRPDKEPSSTEQLMRLTEATRADEIGKFSPSLASLALKDIDAPDHLRLYEAVFGRDSLRVAMDLLPVYPELARTTVLELAKLQGVEYNHRREEEPGRIAHESREKDDVIAQELKTQRGWDFPYYGSVDATPEFVRTLCAYTVDVDNDFLRQTYIDRRGMTRNMAHALEYALEWIDQRMHANPEGLLEYKTELPRGIENQVWKDSWDAYHHKDGTIANHQQGIASIEVQVATYDALLDAAELHRVHRNEAGMHACTAKAERLRQTIFDIFWVDDDHPEGGYFALGTDRSDEGEVRPMRIRTSNMGHALNSRLLKGDSSDAVEKREALRAHLMSDAMLAPSGIRTLASDEYRFRPGAYHNGSVWLWDTHHISKGLAKHGYYDDSTEIDQRLLHVVHKTRAFPEYMRGDWDEPSINQYSIRVYDHNEGKENQIEQPPQEVQAWTVAAIRRIKHMNGRRARLAHRA